MVLVLDPAQVGQAVASIASYGNLLHVQTRAQTSVSTLVHVLVAAHCLGEVPKKEAVDSRVGRFHDSWNDPPGSTDQPLRPVLQQLPRLCLVLWTSGNEHTIQFKQENNVP
jgi:hypothetical protein